MGPDRLFTGYVFDLDGTIYLGDALLPGAREVVGGLRGHHRRLLFLSNNPLATREKYAAKLARLGIPAVAGDVINSSYVLVSHLQRTASASRLFVIGEDSLKKELRGAGFALTERPSDVDIVVAAFDRSFDYRKLQIAFDAIRAGARFIATNRDPFCPVPGGGLPDCGAIIAAVEAATGHQVEEVVGKPSPIMAAVILERLSLEPSEILVVGDRLETDVMLASRAGMASALVLTGAASQGAVTASPIQPDYVVASLQELLPV